MDSDIGVAAGFRRRKPLTAASDRGAGTLGFAGPPQDPSPAAVDQLAG